MGASDDRRRVHFQSPGALVERLDAIADLFGRDRTDLLVEAIREYIEETADDEQFRELVARRYYDDDLDFQTVERLVDPETAHRLRLLKADLDGGPYDLAEPGDTDVYDGDRRSVAPDTADESTDDG